MVNDIYRDKDNDGNGVLSVNEFVPPGFLEVIIDDDKMLEDVRKKVMQKVDPNDDEKLEFNEFQKVIGPVMTPQQETYRPVSYIFFFIFF